MTNAGSNNGAHESASRPPQGSGWVFLAATLACALAIGITVVASARHWIPIDVPAGLMILAIYSPALVAIFLAALTGGRPELAKLLRPLMA